MIKIIKQRASTKYKTRQIFYYGHYAIFTKKYILSDAISYHYFRNKNALIYHVCRKYKRNNREHIKEKLLDYIESYLIYVFNNVVVFYYRKFLTKRSNKTLKQFKAYRKKHFNKFFEVCVYFNIIHLFRKQHIYFNVTKIDYFLSRYEDIIKFEKFNPQITSYNIRLNCLEVKKLKDYTIPIYVDKSAIDNHKKCLKLNEENINKLRKTINVEATETTEK